MAAVSPCRQLKADGGTFKCGAVRAAKDLSRFGREPHSNNEFVDIRMANFHIPTTLVQTLMGRSSLACKDPAGEAAPPRFFDETVDGKPLAYNSLQGKVVVLNFSS